MAAYGPLRMTHTEARQLAEIIDDEIERIVASYRRQGFASTTIDAEVTLILGRQLLRRGVDFLPATAGANIERLEVALAVAEANVSRAKIADGSVDGNMPRGGRAQIRGIPDVYAAALATVEVSRLITEPEWLPRIAEYLAGIGYQVASMDQRPSGLVVDVVPLRNGNGVHQ